MRGHARACIRDPCGQLLLWKLALDWYPGGVGTHQFSASSLSPTSPSQRHHGLAGDARAVQQSAHLSSWMTFYSHVSQTVALFPHGQWLWVHALMDLLKSTFEFRVGRHCFFYGWKFGWRITPSRAQVLRFWRITNCYSQIITIRYFRTNSPNLVRASLLSCHKFIK